MTRSILTWPLLLACVAAGCSTAPATDANAKSSETKTPAGTIVLTPAEQATGQIQVQAVTQAERPDVLHVSGRIARADDRTWRVGVRTEGLVRSVLVNLGDVVRKDQVLARYHADEVREGRAKYRTATADLQKLEAAATLAKRNLDRQQSLLALKAASVLQVDQARQDVVAADAAVANGRTEVERARDLLEDELRVPVDPPTAPDDEGNQVPIVAPAAGYVLEKNVTPGRTVAPGQDAFVLSDLSRVWMLASVRQDALGQTHLGQTAIVTLPGVTDRFKGTITNLGQELDPATRTMPVRIVLDNPNHRLHPEMLADAEIELDRKTSVVSVASDAIQQINGQDIVFVRTAADRFAVRAVQTGPTIDGRTPILDGLKAGEAVVVHGSFTLKSHLLRSTMEE